MFHIVEDSEPIRTILAELIESTGRKTKSFDCPDDYLKFVYSDRFIKPTAIITDVHMPNMTGYQMMKKILEMFPDIKFAVTSGEPDIDGPCKDKACMYLSKPFHPEMIELMVDKFTRCYADEAPTLIGCAEFGDKERFNVDTWTCQKLTCKNHRP